MGLFDSILQSTIHTQSFALELFDLGLSVEEVLALAHMQLSS